MRIPAESNWESDLYKKEPVSAHFFSSHLRCMFYIGGLRAERIAAEQNCGAEVESTRRRWFCGELMYWKCGCVWGWHGGKLCSRLRNGEVL